MPTAEHAARRDAEPQGPAAHALADDGDLPEPKRMPERQCGHVVADLRGVSLGQLRA